jgi:hypothetical protein
MRKPDGRETRCPREVFRAGFADDYLWPCAMTNALRLLPLVLLGLLVGCAEQPPPAWPSSEPAAKPGAAGLVTAGEKREATTASVPSGALDVPEGGCPSTESSPDPTGCTAARALPVALTYIPTKLSGLLPLPGGKVRNQSARDVYAIGSVPGAPAAGAWEIVRIPAGATLGGDLRGDAQHTTMDVDWVSATPPTPDDRGGFTYGPLAMGVKVFDGGELRVVDRPGGGVRFWLASSGSLPNKIATAGQMNGGSAIVYVPRR